MVLYIIDKHTGLIFFVLACVIKCLQQGRK